MSRLRGRHERQCPRRDFIDLFSALAATGLVIHIHPKGYDPALADSLGHILGLHYYQSVSPKGIMERLSA